MQLPPLLPFRIALVLQILLAGSLAQVIDIPLAPSYAASKPAPSFPSSYAIDGSLTTFTSILSTGEDMVWQVDLLEEFYVTEVTLFPRQDRDMEFFESLTASFHFDIPFNQNSFDVFNLTWSTSASILVNRHNSEGLSSTNKGPLVVTTNSSSPSEGVLTRLFRLTKPYDGIFPVGNDPNRLEISEIRLKGYPNTCLRCSRQAQMECPCVCLAGYVGDGTVCRKPISSSPNFMTFPSLVLSGSEILTVDFPANFTTSIEPVAVCTPFYDVNSTTTCRVAVFVQLQRRTLQLVNLGNSPSCTVSCLAAEPGIYTFGSTTIDVFDIKITHIDTKNNLRGTPVEFAISDPAVLGQIQFHDLQNLPTFAYSNFSFWSSSTDSFNFPISGGARIGLFSEDDLAPPSKVTVGVMAFSSSSFEIEGAYFHSSIQQDVSEFGQVSPKSVSITGYGIPVTGAIASVSSLKSLEEIWPVVTSTADDGTSYSLLLDTQHRGENLMKDYVSTVSWVLKSSIPPPPPSPLPVPSPSTQPTSSPTSPEPSTSSPVSPVPSSPSPTNPTISRVSASEDPKDLSTSFVTIEAMSSLIVGILAVLFTGAFGIRMRLANRNVVASL